MNEYKIFCMMSKHRSVTQMTVISAYNAQEAIEKFKAMFANEIRKCEIWDIDWRITDIQKI